MPTSATISFNTKSSKTYTFNEDFSSLIYIATASASQYWTFRLPVGKTMYVYWGDGNASTVSGLGSTNVTVTHSYSDSSDYRIIWGGDYEDLTYIYSNTDVTGDLSVFANFTSVTSLQLSNSTITGELSDINELTGLRTLLLYNMPVSGDVSTLSALNFNSLSIQLTDVTFDLTPEWTGSYVTRPLIFLQNNDFTATMVDNALISFASNIATWRPIIIYLNGTNANRTSASDAAKAALIAAGCTVYVNESGDENDTAFDLDDEFDLDNGLNL
jgi:hypothetical protein